MTPCFLVSEPASRQSLTADYPLPEKTGSQNFGVANEGDRQFYNTISPTEKDKVGKLVNNKYL